MTFAGAARRGTGTEGKRLKQYSPINDNPYEELKGKIKDVVDRVEQEDDVEGI